MSLWPVSPMEESATITVFNTLGLFFPVHLFMISGDLFLLPLPKPFTKYAVFYLESLGVYGFRSEAWHVVGCQMHSVEYFL